MVSPLATRKVSNSGYYAHGIAGLLEAGRKGIDSALFGHEVHRGLKVLCIIPGTSEEPQNTSELLSGSESIFCCCGGKPLPFAK